MPKKAAWRSAIVPGLGQIYPIKDGWKVPFIYGGIVSLGAGLLSLKSDAIIKSFLGEVQYRQAHNE